MPGIEIPLTEKLAILKTLTTGMYVDRVSNKKRTVKERERVFVLERIKKSIPTYILHLIF